MTTDALTAWRQRRRVQRHTVRTGGATRRVWRTTSSLTAALAGGALLGFMVHHMTGKSVYAVGAALGGAVIPGWLAEVRRVRRLGRLSDQLDRAIGHLSALLRSGTPLEASLQQVARSVPAPLGDILGYIGVRLHLGMAFETAIELVRPLPAISDSNDVQEFLTTLVVCHERGANILSTFEAMRQALGERRKHRKRVSDEIGQHVIQTVAIVGIGLFGSMGYMLMAPESMAVMHHHAAGRLTLTIAVLGNLVMCRWIHGTMLRQLVRL